MNYDKRASLLDSYRLYFLYTGAKYAYELIEKHGDSSRIKVMKRVKNLLFYQVNKLSFNKRIRQLDKNHKKGGYEHYKVGEIIRVLPVMVVSGAVDGEVKRYFHIYPKTGSFMSFGAECFKKDD